MKTTAIALIIAIAIIGILAVLGILSTNKYQDRITELEEINTALEIENFAGGAAIIKVKEQADLIIGLQVKEEVLDHTKEMLEYSLTYIHFVQGIMGRNGLIYPEFIIESILEDGLDIEDGE